MNLEVDILIENFIRNTLSKKDKDAFVKRMKEDADFKKQVEFEFQLFYTLNEKEWSTVKSTNGKEISDLETILRSDEIKELKKKLQNINDKYQNSRKNKWFYFSAAAIIVLFFSINLLMQSSISSNKLYTHYINLKDLPSLVVRGEDQNNMVRAQKLFESKNYKESLSIFKQALNTYDYNKAILYIYVGITQAELENYLEAEKTFDTLIDSNLLDATKGHWYKALVYLKKNDISATKQELIIIITNKYYNYKKAEELLKKLSQL